MPGSIYMLEHIHVGSSRGDLVTAPIGWMAAWERRPSDGPSWMGGGGGMHMRVLRIYMP